MSQPSIKITESNSIDKETDRHRFAKPYMELEIGPSPSDFSPSSTNLFLCCMSAYVG